MRVKVRFVCLALAAFVPVASWSQVRPSLQGYAKALPLTSRSLLTDERFFLGLNRVRLQGLLDVGGVLHTEVWLDSELLVGDFLTTPDYAFRQLLQRPTFLDLDWTVAEGERYVLQQRLFRAFATLYLGSAEVTVGRQRIAWGTGFAWNPTDLLNPFNPAAIELDEKEGVDAVHVSLPFGALSRLEAVYAPGRGELEPSFALRVGHNLGGYDFSVMGGAFRNVGTVGGDFVGYLGGAALRGEFAYTWSDTARNFLRAVVNLDYNFAFDLYTVVEFYYNGQGAARKEDYDLRQLLTGLSFNLARFYVAVSAVKTVTPLLQVGVYDLLNLVDGSTLLGPTVTYSLATNLEFSASTYFFLGPDDSEFGALPNVLFGHLQFFF